MSETGPSVDLLEQFSREKTDAAAAAVTPRASMFWINSRRLMLMDYLQTIGATNFHSKRGQRRWQTEKLTPRLPLRRTAAERGDMLNLSEEYDSESINGKVSKSA